MTNLSPAKTGPNPDSKNKLWKLLREPVDMTPFQGGVTLRESLEILIRQLKVPIVVDSEAFKEENPDAPDIYDTQVKFPPLPKQMSFGAALKQMLSRVQPPVATFMVREGTIVVTTKSRTWVDVLLHEKICVIFEKRPLIDALYELSDMTGADIVLDSRVGEKAGVPVTATFRNTATLEDALRTLADLGDLVMVKMPNSIFITTPERAERIRRDLKENPPVSPRVKTPEAA